MIDIPAVFGLLGSITAASLFFPQVWVSFKTKKTNDLAWFGILIGLLNGIFWVIYGLFQADPFIYVTNIILFIGALLLFILKKKYG
ncbi:hypothetical protein HYV86_06735 [Candidatus Woesearchaeota archaeon]|nr:hypothetical protein [Candidatus Woesearchaeota archaeon]